MKQHQVKHNFGWLLVMLCLLAPAKGWATWYDSNNSGAWTTPTIWTPNGTPASGDQLRVNNGHTVTYTGNFNWTSGSIQIATGGTLIINGNLTLNGASLNSLAAGANLVVNGNLTYSGTLNSSSNITVTGSINVTGSLNVSGQVTVGTSVTVNGNISSSANIDVTDDLTVGGSISMSAGLLHVGGDLAVTNQLSASSATVDVDGNLSVANLDFSSGSLIVVDNDLTVQNRLGTGYGTVVVGGDYITNSYTNTWLNQNQMYVFGSNNCTNGNCSYILDQTAWEVAGSPGSEYLTSSWWEDHLAHAGESGDGGSICAASSTFSVEAVTENAGDMSANTFEWAVYGGTISGNTGGGQVSANSGTVDGHTASVISYYGISGTTTYSITVDWAETDFDGAYVAVRQTSADGCSDGLWSVFELDISATAAPTATSPQNFCFGDSHLISNLIATGSNIQWYAVASGGTALSESTELSSGTYYASQTIGGCESTERLAVTVTVSKELAVTGTVTKASCSGNADGAISISSISKTAVAFQNSKNNYIDTGEKLLSSLSAFTIEGWVKFIKSDNTGNRLSLFGQNDVIELGVDGQSIICWTASGGSVTAAFSSYPDDSDWHHIAVSGDGTSLVLYIDGVAVATGGWSISGTYGDDTGSTAKVGGGVWDATGGSFTGSISQVGYWSAALSAADIADRVASQADYSGTETNLIRGYNLDEGTGTSSLAVPNGTASLASWNSGPDALPTWEEVYSYSWAKTGDASFSATTKDLSDLTEGTYTVTVTSGSCSQQTSFTVGVADRLVTINCPTAAEEYSCYGELNSIGSFKDFFELYGQDKIDDSCNDTTTLTLKVRDVIVPHDVENSTSCMVQRWFSVWEGATGLDSCMQTIPLTDTDSPVFADGTLDGGTLAAYAIDFPDCQVEIPFPNVTETCSSVSYLVTDKDGNVNPNYGFNTATNKVLGSFSASTTIKWTITDDCGHSVSAYQDIIINTPKITYDGFALASLPVGLGSGVQPIISSTHEYFADGASTDDGFTYSWKITKDADGTVVYETAAGNSEISISVGFESGIYPTGSYTFELTKSGGSCSATATKTVTVTENTFDLSLLPFGNHCQAGETDTPSKITWEISFEGNGTEPFEFGYTVSWSDESKTIDVCSGTVEDITQVSSTLTHSSGCSDTGSYPFAIVSKAEGSLTVKFEYTLSSRTAEDFTVSITVSGSDKFSVSEVDPSSGDNSETLESWGVPNTTDITTD